MTDIEIKKIKNKVIELYKKETGYKNLLGSVEKNINDLLPYFLKAVKEIKIK